jgi:hypothetical protein
VSACVVEEDKGIFAHSPLDFWENSGKIKTGQNQLDFGILQPLETQNNIQKL